MNERIRQLAKEAGFMPDNFISRWEDEFEKFAELILTRVISTVYGSDISDRKQEQLVQELAHKFGLDK